jgi:hypothetical protein
MHENPEGVEDQELEEQTGYAPADEAEDEAEQDEPEDDDAGSE